MWIKRETGIFKLCFLFVYFIVITECKKRTCPRLKAPAHGHITYRNLGRGGKIVKKTVATVTCEETHVLQPFWSTSLKCRRSGRWSHRIPKCVEKSSLKCSLPELQKYFKNGSYKISDPSLALGTTIAFDCADNYYLTGNDQMSCELSFGDKPSWHPRRVPRCLKVKCIDPGYPKNGRRVLTGLTVGSKMTFFCYSGYELLGSKVRTCLEDGSWSGSITVCDNRVSDCHDPGIPVGGDRYGNDFSLGSVVHYECRRRFTLVGSSVRTCKENGTWSGTEPRCKDERFELIPPLDETIEGIKNNVINALANETCSHSNLGKCKVDRKKGRTLALNTKNGLDLAFLLDASFSIGRGNFEHALRFLCYLIDVVGVDYDNPGGTRVAAVTYSTRASLVYNFGDSRVSTKEKACAQTRAIKYTKGGTGTRYGFQKVFDVVAPHMQFRRAKALLVITDGMFNIGGNPIEIANKIRKQYGVKIYVIGVGKKPKTTNLKLIASEGPGHVFKLKDYPVFEHLIQKLTTKDYGVCGQGGVETKGLIHGGDQSKPMEWPWVIGIFIDYSFVGGGTILNSRTILSAAHVFNRRTDTNAMRIVIGRTHFDYQEKDKDYWLDDRSIAYRVKTLFMHPEFNSTTFANDVALLWLEEPLLWSPEIRPVCLPLSAGYLQTDAWGYVAGWGGTERNIMSRKLLHVRVPVQSNDTCKIAARRSYFNKTQMFCAGTVGKDACTLDSGGPLMIKEQGSTSWHVVGIVSWGFEGICGQADFYGYYTRVISYVRWIHENMSK